MGSKIWTKDYISAMLVMFFLYMVISTLMASLSIYAKNLTGLDSDAGLVISTFTIGALPARFLAGGLIDRFSSKKIIIGGIVILALGSTGLLISKELSGVIFARILQGVGFGLAATATSTFISSICPPERLMEGIGYMSVIQSLTMVLGPSIGFWIIGEKYEHFSALFITSIGVAFVTLIISLFEKDVKHNRKDKTSGDTDTSHVRWAIIILPLVILFTNCLSQSAISSFLALFAISLNLAGVGSFFSINALGVITSRFFMNRLVNQFGSFRMIMINTVIFAVCIFCLTQVTALYQMLILAFPAGFAMGSVGPIVITYLLQSMPEKKGMSNALYFSTMDIGFGIGSVIWGLVAVKFGYVNVFIMSAALQCLGFMLTIIQIKKFSVKKGQASDTVGEIE